MGAVSTEGLNYISRHEGMGRSRWRETELTAKCTGKTETWSRQHTKQQTSKGFYVSSVKMSISGPVCFSSPLPFSIVLSAAQTRLARSVLPPLSASGSDKTALSTWPGQCYAENLVYGPSTEYTSIPIAHDNRDSVGLQPPLCWYQESCRRRVTAKAEAPCLSDTGGKRGSVYFPSRCVIER